MRNKHQVLNAIAKILTEYEKENGRINTYCEGRTDSKGKPLANCLFVPVELMREAQILTSKSKF